MKIAHYEKITQKLLGWYDKDIHTTIPTPNIEVEDEVWQVAVSENANHVNLDGTLDISDFRTDKEIADAVEQDRKTNGEDYDLNGTIYKVPFTSEDANGLMQVNTAFAMGVVSTNIHFSNGVVMPIAAIDFEAFALWFVTKRNSFFL